MSTQSYLYSPEESLIGARAIAAPARRVAMIEPVGGRSGMDHYDFGLSEGLVAQGCRVTLYTCDETRDHQVSGVTLRTTFRRIFGRDPAWKRTLRYLAGTVVTFLHVLRAREEICHFHFFAGTPQELALAITAKVLFRRVVITVHDVESFSALTGRKASLVTRTYQMADRLIVHNAFSRQELIAKLGVSPDKVAVIPHGNYLGSTQSVPESRYARQALRVPPACKVVLFFGQIKDVKGIDVLIGAMSAVIEAVPDTMFVIAGRPWKSGFDQYERLIDQAEVRRNCILHVRFIPDEDVPLYYAAADLVVLPYKRIYQSGVLLLTMSYGKAPVVSDLPGMLEIVQDGENGYVFREGSSADLAQTLIQALRGDEERQRIAERALAHVREHNDWMRIGKLTAQVYAQAGEQQ